MALPPLPALKSLDDFLNGAFDYLIVGGGTAGLAVAAHLSEDPAVTVGVLEAGAAKLGDQNIMCPAAFGQLVGNPEYDWMMQTVPQRDGKAHSYPRGKCLGGSSAINYLVYVRGQAQEYDDWAAVTGYADWNWQALKPYFLKHEGLHPPPPPPPAADDANGSAAKARHAYRAEEHGTDGPVKVSFANWHAPIEDQFHEAGAKLDIGWTVPADAWGGAQLGGYAYLSTIDRGGGAPGLRSYAATAYLLPHAGRANLYVLTDALVGKVELSPTTGGAVQATGVSFLHSGAWHTVAAQREVILTAGSIQTPQILELSGIGAPAVLGAAGIDVVVANDQVGEHLSDHLLSGLVYEQVAGELSLDHLADPATMGRALQTFGAGHGGPLANGVGSGGFLALERIATADEKAEIRRLLAALAARVAAHPDRYDANEFAAEAARYTDPQASNLQILFLAATTDVSRWDDHRALLAPAPPGRTGCTLALALAHPFSRGSVHVASADPGAPPRLDPAFFAEALDRLAMSVGFRVLDAWCATSPLREKLVARVLPPPGVDLRHRAARDAFALRHTGTEYHPVGTARLGKVVDGRLRVMGVRRLRVMDASVVPLHVSGNIQALVYALAERGAEMVRRGD